MITLNTIFQRSGAAYRAHGGARLSDQQRRARAPAPQQALAEAIAALEQVLAGLRAH